MSSDDARRLAWQVLRRIHDDDAYSHLALSAMLDASTLEGRDRALVTELSYGVCTWRRALDRLLDGAVNKGVQSIQPELLDALRLGVYQLRFLDRIPDHAALDETVELARSIDGEGASRLANAVLRRIAREPNEPWWRDEDRERKPVRWLGERYSLPNWIANRLIQQFGADRATALAAAFTTRSPIWVRRINIPFDEAAERHEQLDEAVTHGLESGEMVIQDLGSQLAVRWTGVAPGERVLDACAGVGGKTIQLGEVAGEIVALDPQKSKLELLSQVAERLGVTGKIESVEGELQTAELPGEFDGVLVDAPCTGLGTLRRHPETRWRKREADITVLSSLQAELLDHASALVAPGGWLTYSVCTWTREESSKQAEKFLARHPQFRLDQTIGTRIGRPSPEGYLRTMPDSDDADGFFAARFVRDE